MAIPVQMHILHSELSFLKALHSSQGTFVIKQKLILQKKQSTEECGLFKGHPEEFKKYFEHVRSLHSNKEPNYTYLRRLFRNLFSRNHFEYDYVFDWTELKFLEELKRKKGTRDC